MSATQDPRPDSSSDDIAVGLAARLCWHAFQICQAMAASLDALQDDLAEISVHCDALIEMAIDLDRQTIDRDVGAAHTREARGRNS